MELSLGSLFDGIGAFPRTALKHGIVAKWASEIEAFPIKATEYHFPGMEHLGDITFINGAEIEPVDIISFGSPCQDMSVAGKRAGLEGKRSGLFMEAVRIIQEMRVATNGVYPRFAIWENVPGAFSSNDGNDFRAVLEEITETEIPMPPSGRWAEAGMVRGNGCEVSWRCFDAQYWGVPQRRKRIFLVADFRGERAGEILFERTCLSRHSAESGEAWEEVATSIGDGVNATSYAFYDRNSANARSIGLAADLAPTLKTENSCGIAVGQPITFRDVSGTLRANAGAPKHEADWEQLVCQPSKPIALGKIAGCLSCGAHPGGFNGQDAYSNQLVVHSTNIVLNDTGGQFMDVSYDVAPTLRAEVHNHPPCVITPIAFNGRQDPISGPVSGALGASLPQAQCIAYPDPAHTLLAKANLSYRGDVDTVVAVDVRNLSETEELSGTLQSKNSGGYSLNYQNPIRIGYRVRRLTPTECLRLQGFPDNWLDIQGASDSAKYKAVGNSIANPCPDFIFGRLVEVLSREKGDPQ